MTNRALKLAELAAIEGEDEMQMMETASYDGVSPGICINDDCDYTVAVEPDCRDGWCEECQTNTVESCLVLAGVI